MNMFRVVSLLLALALLFSGDVVRLHGHPDGAPASSDCAACVTGLHAPMAAEPPRPHAVTLGTMSARSAVEPGDAPSFLLVRRGGLRDPPFALA